MYDLYHTHPVEIIFEFHFFGRAQKSTVATHRIPQLVLDMKEPDPVTVCVIFILLSNKIPHQNSFTNKIHGDFVAIDLDSHL